MSQNQLCAVEMPSVRRVLIVDDHPVVRQGLRYLLEKTDDLSVCGEAENAKDARAAIDRLNPDVLICDISLRQVDGIELVRSLRAHYPRLPILVLSALDESHLFRAHARSRRQRLHHEAGVYGAASGVAAAGAGWEHLCIRGNEQQPAVGIRRRRGASVDPLERLTNRELQILHLIGKGTSTRETAQLLHLSIKTIESHRQRIKRKLHLTNGAQLLRYAVLSHAQRLANSPASND